MKQWLYIAPLAAWLTLFFAHPVHAQRVYRDSSVLATGTWYKLAVRETGIYKIDLAFLRSLGMSTTSIPSATIALYGNGGQMLPESCSGSVTDDLRETPLQVNDGGDGLLDGADYILFFAPGPDRWRYDTLLHSFAHSKNLYSGQSCYFLRMGIAGKRVPTVSPTGAFTRSVSQFDEHYFHELDTVNLLNSGKSWYGEDFAAEGGTSSRTFRVPFTDLLPGPSSLRSDCISRSIGSSSSFQVSVNGSRVLTHTLGAVGAGNLDLFVNSSQETASFTLNTSAASVSYTYQSGGFGAQGWLDWFELQARRNLSLSGSSQLLFRDLQSLNPGGQARFSVQGADASTQVWDVTDPLSPYRLAASLNGTELQFINDCSVLHDYIAFRTGFLTPVALGKVANQNLHGLSSADLIIITHPAVYNQAARLAAWHRQHDHLKTIVVNATDVYNEFASGSPDPVALRDFVKMFYDRARNDPAAKPRYLLLFGDASYDYRNRLRNNTNLVPAYESSQSADPLATYVSDDFFGFLDDGEDITADSVRNLLDIGIGRIPAATAAQAKAYVDKVLAYTDTAARGAWRNRITFVADDEDFNLHLHDAETVAGTADTVNPSFLPVKIYLDAYHQESTSAGSRYPAVNQDIARGIDSGTLIWNYSGHGSARRLAEEVVLDEDIAASWNNAGRLPLFITATCDFAPYDNPVNYSLGEDILLKEKTGAIALMTTTRLVFAYSNRIINQHYMQVALQPKAGGGYNSLGEAVMKAKNDTYLSYSDVVNNRKFTLLGDPALTLAFPAYRVETTAINGKAVAGLSDTLKALQSYTFTGQVRDPAGVAAGGFDGTVNVTVYDKVQQASTLANDPESLQETFPVQQNILFQGLADVRNGRFSYSFLVPKDISYLYGPGRISYYVQGGGIDGNGAYSNFVIGGSAASTPDTKGPDIRILQDNGSLLNGSTTDPGPGILFRLSDSSGINTLGTGIGHDITAVLDGGKAVYILNNDFQAGLNTYREGTIRLQLYNLAEGSHTLQLKAWDGANNSTLAVAAFTVEKKKSFTILRTVNFPNPVTGSTTFHFEHDAAVKRMEVSVMIFTADGRLIKAVKKTINTGASRFCDVEWDGKNEAGARPLKGAYFYRILATTDLNTRAVSAGKLLIW